MNYLAHIFLSGSNRKVQLGNFVGDAVKGSSYKNYPPDIAKGIQLHRAIDDYTDRHPAVCEVVHRLQPEFGRYSGVLLDIYFDYLLASRFESFSGVSLRRYTRTFYLSLLINYRYLPLRFKRFIWHFKAQNRTSVVRISGSCSKKQMMPLLYESPDGKVSDIPLWEGGNATGTIELYRRIGGSLELIDRLQFENGLCAYQRS